MAATSLQCTVGFRLMWLLAQPHQVLLLHQAAEAAAVPPEVSCLPTHRYRLLSVALWLSSMCAAVSPRAARTYHSCRFHQHMNLQALWAAAMPMHGSRQHQHRPGVILRCLRAFCFLVL